MVKHRKPKPNKNPHMSDPRNREAEVIRIAEEVMKAPSLKELAKAGKN